MRVSQMVKLTRHFDTCFEQSDSLVLHSMNKPDPLHIDVLLYPPNQKYAFWKLVTMGASDYRMPPAKPTFSRYNEYIMLVDADEDLNDRETALWYYRKLMMVANYPAQTKTHITYGHSLEWEPEEVFPGQTEQDEMIGAFLELPGVIENNGILYCKLGIFKKVACLQVVLLNRAEVDTLLKIGGQQFSEYLCPEEGRPHFLSERRRSEKF